MNLLESDIAFVTELVYQAGEALLKYFQSKNLAIQEKSKNNPVTAADFAANEILVSGLLSRFPQDAILSEEESPQMEGKAFRPQKSATRIWVLDPLDGTKEFIEGRPQFAVSVGLLYKQEPIYGWVFNPAQGVCFSGGPQRGLQENGQPLSLVKNFRVKNSNTQTRPLLALSRTETQKGLFDFLQNIPHLPPPLRLGSIAWKLALLAGGEVDLVVSRKPKNIWDVAAAAALLKARSFLFLNKKWEPIVLDTKAPLLEGIVGGAPQHIQFLKNILKEQNLQL